MQCVLLHLALTSRGSATFWDSEQEIINLNRNIVPSISLTLIDSARRYNETSVAITSLWVLLLMKCCYLWKGLWSSLHSKIMGALSSRLPTSVEEEMEGRAVLLIFLSGLGCRKLESAHGRAIRRPDSSFTVFALSVDFEYFPHDNNSGFGTSSRLKRLDWFEFQIIEFCNLGIYTMQEQ